MAIKDPRHRGDFPSILGVRSCFSHGGKLESTCSDTNVKTQQRELKW